MCEIIIGLLKVFCKEFGCFIHYANLYLNPADKEAEHLILGPLWDSTLIFKCYLHELCGNGRARAACSLFGMTVLQTTYLHQTPMEASRHCVADYRYLLLEIYAIEIISRIFSM